MATRFQRCRIDHREEGRSNRSFPKNDEIILRVRVVAPSDMGENITCPGIDHECRTLQIGRHLPVSF